MIPNAPIIYAFGILLMLLITLVHMYQKLEETRREIEELKRETFQTNQFLRQLVLGPHHPEISDSPVFKLEVDEERARRSSLGKMLEAAKENARSNPHL